MLFQGRDLPEKVVMKNATTVGWASVLGGAGEMITSAF